MASALYNSNINAQDKAELMINITALINENTYDKQIKALRKEKNKKFCSYVFFFVSLHDFVDFGLEGAKIHLTKG